MQMLAGVDFAGVVRLTLGRGATLRFQARGSSMSPFIRDNDWVTIAPLRHRLPRLGEVVAVVHPATGKLILHRVVGCPGGGYLIKGDRSEPADGRVASQDVVGRVESVERGRKRIGFGLGPERLLIAALSRSGLFRIARPLARLYRARARGVNG